MRERAAAAESYNDELASRLAEAESRIVINNKSIKRMAEIVDGLQGELASSQENEQQQLRRLADVAVDPVTTVKAEDLGEVREFVKDKVNRLKERLEVKLQRLAVEVDKLIGNDVYLRITTIFFDTRLLLYTQRLNVYVK
jgi:hypothetical protein